MKRKTNIFYLDGDDSKFLTFSNYAEYMTGNFLSINTKLFTTHFLCLELPFNETKTVEEFKKFLIEYYENKLAYIKDNLINNDQNSELYYPLKYLFDSISSFFGGTGNVHIKYISDIVEQSYNGTYADNICIVDLSHKCYSCIVKNCKLESEINKNENIPLYGWGNELNRTDYANLHPIYDNENNGYDRYDESNGPYIDEFNNRSYSSLSFNCVIPLFRIKNIDENINNENTDDDITSIRIDLNKDIPLGIWFNEVDVINDDNSNSKKIKSIELYSNDKYSQSWSLTICSSFSTLPFGVKNTYNEETDILDDEDDIKIWVKNYIKKMLSEQINYKTYADVLSEQSSLLKKLNTLIIENNKLKDEIQSLNLKISELYNLSSIKDLNNIIEYINEKYSEKFEETNKKITDFEEKLENFKWKYIN